jgi:hypothetical protein
MKSAIIVASVLLTALLDLSIFAALAYNGKTNATMPSNVTNATNVSSNATSEAKLATNPFAKAKGALPIDMADAPNAVNGTNSTNATTK